MSSSPAASRDERLAPVEASPAAVSVHDKAAWLDLFAADAQVQDPVGSRPHAGRGAIGRFYDTFIAPNDIRFLVDHDVVCGNTVVRDLVIETRMATGLTVKVPTHIRYELTEEAGRFSIHRLYAHWELLPMVIQTLGAGLLGLRTYAGLGVHMIACQGLGGVFGFMRGFGGVGRRGKRRAERLLAALGSGDAGAAAGVLASGAVLELPAGRALDLDGILQEMQGLEWRKLLAAGRCVTATVTRAGARGVVLLEFGGNKIERVRFYLAEG